MTKLLQVTTVNKDLMLRTGWRRQPPVRLAGGCDAAAYAPGVGLTVAGAWLAFS